MKERILKYAGRIGYSLLVTASILVVVASVVVASGGATFPVIG